MVSMTGSVEGGVKIMHAAADNVTKVSLELGGKAPAIVMADADLDLAAKAICASRVINTGQVCNCAERVYVHESVADAFVTKIVAAMKAVRYGDPLQDETLDMGPLVSQAQLENVEAAVAQALNDGAKCLLGGKRAGQRPGFYFEPTVLHRLPSRLRDHAAGDFWPRAAHHHLQEVWTRLSSSRMTANSASRRPYTPRASDVVHARLQRDQVWRDLCQPREL